MRPRLMPITLLSLLISLIVCPSPYALDYYVDGSRGRDVSSYGYAPDRAWKTIGYAIENARPSVMESAVIYVASGTYSTTSNGETLPLLARANLTLVGEKAENTIIDGEGRSELMRCRDAQGLVLQGLTLTRGRNGAMFCENSDIEVRYCLFARNRALCYYGSAVESYGCRLNIENSSFMSNTNQGGADIFFLHGSDVTLANCKMVNNEGGILLDVLYGQLRMSHCRIEDNTAAAFNCLEAEVSIENCVISRNARGQRRVAVIQVDTSSVTLSGCVINDNESTWSTIMLATPTEPGFPAAELKLDNCLIAGNVSNLRHLIESFSYTSYCSGPAEDRLETASRQGVGSLSIDNCTIHDNHGSNNDSLFFNAADCYIHNTILWHNSGDVFEYPHSGTYLLDVTHCCLEEEFEGEGNFVADPMLVSGPLGDYYLSSVEAGQEADSPCIDAGSTCASIAGVGRLTTRTDGEFDGGVVDIGYHYSATPPTISCEVSDGSDALDAQPFQPGDNLIASINLANGGLSLWVDVYAGFILPDGTIFCITPDGLTTDFAPFIEASHLRADSNSGDIIVFDGLVPGGLPEGAYTFAAALSLTGAFRPIGDVATTGFAVGGVGRAFQPVQSVGS